MSNGSSQRPWLALSQTSLKVLLTLHIIVSVGLLGDSAGYLAVAIHGSTAQDPATARASYQILQMFAFVFGIPLSFAALISSMLLSVGTRWSALRYPWMTTKLLMIGSVIMVGAFVLKGGMDAMLTGRGGGEGRLIAGAAYDVVALTIATILGVFKPGGPWSSQQWPTRIKLHER